MVENTIPVSNSTLPYSYKESAATNNQQSSNSVTINPSDGVTISPALKYLLSQGVNINESEASILNSITNFHLIFEAKNKEQLTADGYFSEKTKSMDLSFTYTFQQEISNNGVKEMHTFQADFSLKLQNIDNKSIKPFEKKEDIMDFVRRLVKEIMEIAKDKDKLLGGVIFDQEDLEELSKIENGKLMQKIQELIATIIIVARMQAMMEQNKDQELVLLQTKREKTSSIDISIEKSNISDFSLTIKDITDKSGLTEESSTEAASPEITETETSDTEVAPSQEQTI
ncbi:MAG: hypothetical protein PHX21_04685 [bacterium]|nr:hypothetical protein [bacterium]